LFGSFDPQVIVLRFIALVLAITVHEFSHALAGTLLGDDTPRRDRRVTLNPLAHLDPLGTLLILIGPIGWGRPVLVNPMKLRPNPAAGFAIVAAAGPFSNLVLATLTAALWEYGLAGSGLGQPALLLVRTFFILNIALMVFNLIPIPPLDGFNVLVGIVPGSIRPTLESFRAQGPLLLLALVFISSYTHIDILGAILEPGYRAVSALIDAVVGS